MSAFDMTFAGVCKSRTEAAGISPGHGGSYRDFVHSRQFLDAAECSPDEN